MHSPSLSPFPFPCHTTPTHHHFHTHSTTNTPPPPQPHSYTQQPHSYTQHGTGTANTALAYHAKRLLALHEGDLPYHIRLACEGVVETVGRVVDDDMESPFTAHPKVCPVTGRWCGVVGGCW